MKAKMYQKFNKKIGAWVKMKKDSKGRTVIINVKQSKPKVAFANVPKMK